MALSPLVRTCSRPSPRSGPGRPAGLALSSHFVQSFPRELCNSTAESFPSQRLLLFSVGVPRKPSLSASRFTLGEMKDFPGKENSCSFIRTCPETRRGFIYLFFLIEKRFFVSFPNRQFSGRWGPLPECEWTKHSEWSQLFLSGCL